MSRTAMPTFRTESTAPPPNEAVSAAEQEAQLQRAYAEMRQQALELREELIAEFRPIPAEHLASLLEPATSVERIINWRRGGKIFSVPYNGVDLYPTFQFESGRPKAVVKSVLKLLREERPEQDAEGPYLDWDILCWFVGVNSWLEGATLGEAGIPVERMDVDSEAVVVAASHARDRISD